MTETETRIVSQIVKDPTYLTWMDTITESSLCFAEESRENGIITLDHGLYHSFFVARTTARLLCQYGAENLAFLGYIAGLLHDIGMIEGKKGHASKSAEMASSYLENIPEISREEREIIVHAIRNHGDCKELLNPVDGMLSLADKYHYQKKRLLPSSYTFASPINKIENQHIYLAGNKLRLFYETSSDNYKDAFYCVPKSITIPKLVGEKMGLEVEIYVNDHLETFADQDQYEGFVYGKGR